MGNTDSALANVSVKDAENVVLAFRKHAKPRSEFALSVGTGNSSTVPRSSSSRNSDASVVHTKAKKGPKKEGILRSLSGLSPFSSRKDGGSGKGAATGSDFEAAADHPIPTKPSTTANNDDDLVLDKVGILALLNFPEDAVDEIMHQFDADHDGLLSLQEFAAFLAVFCRGDDKLEIATSQKVKILFSAFDSDKSGFLDRKELSQLFDAFAGATKNLGFRWSTEARESQLDSALPNQTEKISLKEFRIWAKKDAQMQQFLRRLADMSANHSIPLSMYRRRDGDTRVRILCLDGGGMKGVIQAAIVARIERSHPGFINSIDAFAGTSVGSLLAASYCMAYHPDKVLADFEKEAPRMFESYAGTVVSSAKRLVTSGNSNEYFQQGVKEAFGDVNFGSLEKKLLIPTFKLVHHDKVTGRDTWKPKFFHNWDCAPGLDDDHDVFVRDAVMRSMATPTYFESFQGYIDGGVVANAPSMCALAQMIAPQYGNKQMSDVIMLSIGSGEFPECIHEVKEGPINWGLAQWARPLYKILSHSSDVTAHFQCKMMLGQRYHRTSPLFEDRVSMDDPVIIPQLRELGESFDLSVTDAWLKAEWF